MKEHSVMCDWCGAKEGEPCKKEEGEPYPEGTIHRRRRMIYNELHRLINNRPTDLLPPKPRSVNRKRHRASIRYTGVRTS